MNLQEFYTSAIEAGKKCDPRGRSAANKDLRKRRQEYDNLPKHRRKYFGTELLENPYPDSLIIVPPHEDIEVKRLVISIDGAQYVIKYARDKDAILLTHHPEGIAEANLHLAWPVYFDSLRQLGITDGMVEGIPAGHYIKKIRKRAMREDKEDWQGDNVELLPDYARLVGVPWVTMHTIADMYAHAYVKRLLEHENPKTLGDVVDVLMTIKEYQVGAMESRVKPWVILGGEKRKTGKIMLDMIGGGEPPEKIFNALAGRIDTIIVMHADKDLQAASKKNKVAMVCASHIQSDTLGMNLLLSDILPDDVEVYPTGGFRRVEDPNRMKELMQKYDVTKGK